MRLPQSPTDAAILSTLLFPFLSAAAGYQCDHFRVDGTSFNLETLGGPRSVLHMSEQGGHNHTTTFTVDICKSLGKVKDVESNQQCPHGTRVCAINRLIGEDHEEVNEVIPIAGELKEQGGDHMDPKFERLKTSASHADSEKEGIRVEMNGGFRLMESDGKKKQKAIIEFICDKERTGLENLYDPKEKYDDTKPDEEAKREEGDKVDEDDPKSSSLELVKWDQTQGDVDILRLKWRTSYACEDAKDEEEPKKSNSWGFFTWFILIAFLSTATYLIFGSWLNYNRYGARGWDLLPHGDTIRDVPYLFKDWMRRVLNTIQGGGSRGGYAAV